MKCETCGEVYRTEGLLNFTCACNKEGGEVDVDEELIKQDIFAAVNNYDPRHGECRSAEAIRYIHAAFLDEAAETEEWKKKMWID